MLWIPWTGSVNPVSGPSIRCISKEWITQLFHAKICPYKYPATGNNTNPNILLALILYCPLFWGVVILFHTLMSMPPVSWIPILFKKIRCAPK